MAEENAYDDNDEQIVIRDMAEYVYFIFAELSCVEEVENLQENESIEENTQMNSCLIVPVFFLQADGALHAEDLRTSEQDND